MLVRSIIWLFAILSQCGIDNSEGLDAHSWEFDSAIYAEIQAVDNVGVNEYLIRLRPVATITGKLDPTLNRELTANAYISLVAMGDTGMSFVPQPRSKALIVVHRYMDDGVLHVCIPNGRMDFIAGGYAIAEVGSFEDKRVTDTIQNLRRLRKSHREDAEAIEHEHKSLAQAQYHNVSIRSATLLAQVTGYEETDFGPATIRLHTVAALSGDFDCAYTGEIKAKTFVGGKSEIQERPAIGAKVLVLVNRDEKGKYAISDEPVPYFPDDHGRHPALQELVNFDDKAVLETADALKKIRAEKPQNDDGKKSSSISKPVP